MPDSVIKIDSLANWQAAVSTDQVVIADFTATWCGPCRAIAPVFAKLSSAFPSIKFVKVDVDEVADVASLVGISCMPTFQVWRNGIKVEEVVGANPAKLTAICEKLAASPALATA